MRDFFEEPIEPERPNPMEAARRAMRPQARKRFYETVGVVEGEGAFAMLLDGRPVKTPAGRALAAPVRPLAEALAEEWRAQAHVIDPTSMPLTRLANSIIDGVAHAPGAVADEIEKYLASDLLFYRATTPEGLVARQREAWDPILEWARETLGAAFLPTESMTFLHQRAEAIAAACREIPRDLPAGKDVWRLGALHSVTTLTGSALIALALALGRLGVEDAWAAAHVDEDWNMDQWGRDTLALERRAYRYAEMQAAAAVLDALR